MGEIQENEDNDLDAEQEFEATIKIGKGMHNRMNTTM